MKVVNLYIRGGKKAAFAVLTIGLMLAETLTSRAGLHFNTSGSTDGSITTWDVVLQDCFDHSAGDGSWDTNNLAATQTFSGGFTDVGIALYLENLNISPNGFSGSLQAGAQTPADYGCNSTASASMNGSVVYYLNSGYPFLFQVGGSALATFSGDAGSGSTLNLSYWTLAPDNTPTLSPNHYIATAAGPTNFSKTGLATSITADFTGIASTGISGLTGDSGADFNLTLQFDENVAIPPDDMMLQASSGQCGVVLSYPPVTTYTGLTEAQLTNISSITYTPPAGSLFSYAFPPWITATRVINYKWGISQTNTFGVTMNPGIAPPDIVRASWDGKGALVYFTIPNLINCIGTATTTVTVPSGNYWLIGTNTDTVFSQPTFFFGISESFNITVVDAKNIAALYPNDTDGDGVPDWQEIIAGTDWHDPTDWFHIQNWTRAGNDIQISWWGAGGITYQLQSFVPGSNISQPIGAPVTPTVPRQLITVTDPGAFTNNTSRFYRVAVLPQ
jgi:hypothetical protein